MRGLLVFIFIFAFVVAFGLSVAEAQNGFITYGSTVSSTLSDQRASETWQFSGKAGDVVLIFMNRTSGNLDTYISLLNNNSIVLAKNDDYKGTDSAIINYLLPYDGVYYIRADRFQNTNGNYLLSLYQGAASSGNSPVATPLESTGGGALQYGQFVRSAITRQTASENWTFYGNAGDTVSMVMSVDVNVPGSAELDPYLYLYDPNGRLIDVDDDSRGGLNAQITQTLPMSGTYRVTATSYVQKTTGAYWLFLALDRATTTQPPQTVSNSTILTVAPPGSTRLGDFAVEWYCEESGYGVTLINNRSDWACTNRSNESIAFVLSQSDFNAICQITYNDPAAFAVRDQRKVTVAYNWSCYTYTEGVVIQPTATPFSPLGRAIGTLTPKLNVEVNVRSGPGTSYQQLGRINWQQSFPLLEIQNEWYVINYNGQRGYISARWADILLTTVGK